MWQTLQRLHREGRLARIERARGALVCGFVDSSTDELAVIHVVSADGVFDGSVVIRTDDVEAARWGSAALAARAISALESPTAPEILDHVDLASWASALPALSEHEPILTLHRELDGVYEVATEVVVCGDHVEAEVVDAAGRRNGSIAFQLSDLTRVDFGGTYERNFARRLRHARTVG